MSYLASTDPEQPIEIPGTGGKTVTFRSGASFGDDLAIDLAVWTAVPANGQPLSPEQSIRRQEMRVLARTARMIVAWDLTDADGSPLPVTPDSVRRLTPPVGNWLNGEAFTRFEGRPEEREVPFEKPSPEPSGQEAPKTRK